MVKCYTNAYKGFPLSLSLFCFPLLLAPPLSSSPSPPPSPPRRLSRHRIARRIGIAEHPLVIVAANPLAAARGYRARLI